MPLKGCQGLLSGNYRDIEKIPSKRYADTQKHSHQSESDHESEFYIQLFRVGGIFSALFRNMSMAFESVGFYSEKDILENIKIMWIFIMKKI